MNAIGREDCDVRSTFRMILDSSLNISSSACFTPFSALHLRMADLFFSTSTLKCSFQRRYQYVKASDSFDSLCLTCLLASQLNGSAPAEKSHRTALVAGLVDGGEHRLVCVQAAGLK